ncbi:MAG: hypothetical protein JXA22_07395 [Candidatus Thermoplasmatota archaeon]|nr:hypothetical protein [Candidatus Thermoplasmatota archaeon]
MRYGMMAAGLVMVLLTLVVPIVSALEPVEWEGEIEPRTIEGFPMITFSDCESIDIEVQSDIPVSIYIVDTQEDFQQLVGLSEGDVDNFTDYEKKYEQVTQKTITQDYDPEKAYYVIIFNPSETESASVTVQYEFWEDVGEEVVTDVCCSSIMGASLVVIVLLTGAVIIAAKRK